MRPVWPASLPQHVGRQDYQYVHGDSRLPQPSDGGSTRQRRRLSFVPDVVRCSMQLTEEQRLLAIRFIDVELVEGIWPFDFPSIPPGAPTWVVQIGQNMPAWSAIGNRWRLSLELVRLK